MEFLQLRLQRLEVADGVLEGRVRTQGLQLHQVSADVVEAHVCESAPATGGDDEWTVVWLQVIAQFESSSYLSELVKSRTGAAATEMKNLEMEKLTN